MKFSGLFNLARRGVLRSRQFEHPFETAVVQHRRPWNAARRMLPGITACMTQRVGQRLRS